MNEKWIQDTGLVFALFFLILGYAKDDKNLLVISGIFLAVSLFIPIVMYPIAFLWLKFTELLRLIIPKIFFGFVFFVIILPMGVFRRVTKGDTLFLSKWREAKTVFINRNHLFNKQDLENPY
jgi:hypothetical protein